MFSQEIFGETVAVLAEQALEVTGHQVNFNIYDGANGVIADDRNVCRMGNDIGFEATTRYLVDGKTDPVDTNRTLPRDVARILRWYVDAQPY